MITTPPNGTKDLDPQDCRIRKQIFDRLCFVAEKRAFQQIETPAFERIETMQGKYGEEGEKLFFKILKRGEQSQTGECDLALRYDLTVPAMRYYIANKNKLPKIFKRYQYGPVWRAERPGKGRFRQFYQFDFDIYGTYSLTADLECLNVIVDCLNSLGIKDYVIRLNSRKLLQALMKAFDIPDNLFQPILILIDKVDKIGVEGLNENLNPYRNIGKIDELSKIFLQPDYNKILLNIIESRKENELCVEELRNMVSIAKMFSLPQEIKIDMTLARGLDYYTGPIYELEIPSIKGSIAAGGRYDFLSKLFTSEAIPVCGASLGIERIIPLLDIEKFSICNDIDFYLTYFDNEYQDIYQLSLELRKKGFSVEIQQAYSGKFKKELSYANQIGAKYFIYQGENEKISGKYFVKDMQSSKIEGVYSYEQVINLF